MANETQRRLARSVVGLVASAVVAFFAAPPDRVLAHGNESHTAATAEADSSRAAGETAAIAGSESDATRAQTHPYPPDGVPRPLAWLGKLHPPLTHFPIALLTAAAFAELLLLWRAEERYRHTVRFCIWTGSLAAIATAPLGWLFAGFRIADADWVLTTHRWLGTGTALWAVALIALCERADRRGASRRGLTLALLAGTVLVAATGFFGGSLHYGLDHYAW